MNNILQISGKIDNYFRTKSFTTLFIIFFFIEFFYSTTTALIATQIDPSLTYNPIDDRSRFVIFIVSVIIAPVIETLIYQLAIMEISYKFKLKESLAISISSILFGLSHNYNWVYMAVMIFIGFIFAYSYSIIRSKYGTFKATVFVILLHAMANLITFLNNEVFEFF